MYVYLHMARLDPSRPSWIAILPQLALLLLLLCPVMIRAAAMKATSETPFRLAGLGRGGILIGQAISPKADAGVKDKSTPREPWALKSGLYTPRQLVEGFAPLLDTVVFRLGQDPEGSRPSRARLLDNLAANLDTNTREATLRFPSLTDLDASRREIADQARRIGKTLVDYARNHTAPEFNPDLYLRSPCEGHLLIPPNVDLMFGRRSQAHLMQLFNEYMHQMVLLRDALLPFQNYEDVVIPVDGQAARGIRHLEPSRSQFLASVLTKEATQAVIVKQAQALLAPKLLSSGSWTASRPGYGFQYAHGVVLPAVLAGGKTPFHLLRYLPTRLVEDTAKDVVFDYRIQDYYVAPRVEIPTGTEKTTPNTNGGENFPEANGWGSPALHVVNAKIGVVPPNSGSTSSSSTVRQLELQLELDNDRCVSVDVGQVSRGHRYAYMASTAKSDQVEGKSTVERSTAPTAVIHDVASVLLGADKEDGLITAKEGGFHVIPNQDSLVSLAVLGKIYPENVVLLPESESLSQAETAGKGLEPKFVIWGGVQRGGFRGSF